MVVFQSIESIFTIMIIISIGYYLTHKKWLNDNIARSFAKLVVNVALPAYMISNLLDNFDKNKLESLAKGLLIPFLSIFLSYLLAVLFSKVLKIRKERYGTFQSMFFNSNTIFIGLPVNMALFGKMSLPYVLLYYIANTTFFWTLGVYCISKDAPSGEYENMADKSGFNVLKRIISPPLLGFMIAIVFILLNIKLPKFIMDSCTYIGNLTTPLSMIFIGIGMYYVNIRKIRFSKDVVGVLAGRFVISPLIMFAIVCFLPIPSLMKKVFIIQSAMPVMTNAPIVAKEYGSDSSYASVMVTLSTLVSMVIIPVLMVLFQHI